MKLYNYSSILAMLALAACSSMEVDSDEAVAENFPADFVASEYVQLHPELVSLQVRDYVKDYNKSLDLDNDAVTADTTAFMADTAKLHVIFTDPQLGGFDESIWIENWTDNVSEKDSCTITKIDTISVGLRDIAGDSAVHVYKVDSLGYGEDNKLVYVRGLSDSSDASSKVDYPIDAEKYKLEPKLIVKDTIQTCEKVNVTVKGGIPKDQRKYLFKFNFNNTQDDIKSLKKIELDTTAIVDQYLVYGKLHGWAYRSCSGAEKSNPVGMESYPAKLLYCDDNGVAREIK